jgi:uracil-DNA glycosylase
MTPLLRPDRCDGCPLARGPGGFVPPICTCPGCREGDRLAEGIGCTAGLIAVGIAPGEEEERRQEPFVGPAGRLLTGAFKHVGIAASVRKMNLVQCRTVREGRTKLINRDPTAAEIRECAQRWLKPVLENLQYEISGDNYGNGVAGKVPATSRWVLALGELAFRYLAGPGQGTWRESRGHRLRVDLTNLTRPVRVTARLNKPRLCQCGAPLAPRKRKCPKCRKN